MCDDIPEFCTVADVRARKPHQCCECRDEIAKGEIYERQSGKWSGDLATYKTCLTCRDIRNAIAKIADELWGDACYYFGGLREAVADVCDYGRAMECIENIPGVQKFIPSQWLEAADTVQPEDII